MSHTKAMQRSGVLATLCLTAIFLLTACGEDDLAPPPERPNIVLVMTDDQGYGDLGFHNNPIVQTPEIDQLAAESTRLSNFHVDPTCSPTRAALMSGQYSLRAGVWHTVMGRHRLDDKHRTLAEELRDAGYSTALFGKWHLGDNYPFRPQDQGFDHVVVHGGGGVGQSPDYWGNTQFDDSYFRNGVAVHYPGFTTDAWFDEAITYVEEVASADKPFFLFMSTNAPHSPWRAPDEYTDPYRALGLDDDMALFYAMITNIDDNLGRLRDALNDNDVADNTIVIFTTDNGSALAGMSDGEPASMVSEATRAAMGTAIATLNSDMRGGKASVYDGGHRVPFFIHWPAGGLDAGRDLSDLTAHIDVMPTLLDIAGIDPSTVDSDGLSLRGLIEGRDTLPDRSIVITNQRVLDPDPSRPFAVMQGDWRYVQAVAGGDVELFNLEQDPGQANNVIEEFPERASAMAATYDAWWQDVTSAGFTTTRPVVGNDAENPLRISAMDWLAPTTREVPWWPGFGDDKWNRGWFGNEENYTPHTWALNVAKADDYRVTLYLHDKPAGTVVPRDYAHLELNGQTQTNRLVEGSHSAAFDVTLEAGDLDIRGWFSNGDATNAPLAAFYLYVERIEP